MKHLMRWKLASFNRFFLCLNLLQGSVQVTWHKVTLRHRPSNTFGFRRRGAWWQAANNGYKLQDLVTVNVCSVTLMFVHRETALWWIWHPSLRKDAANPLWFYDLAEAMTLQIRSVFLTVAWMGHVHMKLSEDCVLGLQWWNDPL